VALFFDMWANIDFLYLVCIKAKIVLVISIKIINFKYSFLFKPSIFYPMSNNKDKVKIKEDIQTSKGLIPKNSEMKFDDETLGFKYVDKTGNVLLKITRSVIKVFPKRFELIPGN
jgi:hypothetical protein